ncbi:MAG: hypothetical protein HYY32_04515 [Chloroflexi bacterium]|nr:hypothetical protein [Chloroflexota bacterium]
MSRLLQKIKSITESSAPAVGFRTAATSTMTRGPLLAAVLAHPDARSAKAAVEAGADALLAQTSDAKAWEDIVKAAAGAPCGPFLPGGDADLKALEEAGCDFVSFSPSTAPARWLRVEGLARIARVPYGAEVSSLRGIDKVGIDAVVLENEGSADFLSVQQLMNCHFLVAALNRPLLAAIPASASAEDVAALWDAGVDGLVVAEGGLARLRELHKIVTAMPPRSKKRAGKETVLLPQMGQPAAPAEEEDDEE